MVIEIRSPELEALIRERMSSGAFRDIEEVILQALRSSDAHPPAEAKKPADLWDECV